MIKMTKEKFLYDSQTVLKFIQYYCDHKHTIREKPHSNINLYYKNYSLKENLDFKLCFECKKTFYYSYMKLQACPHDEKPSCRKCIDPCYGRDEWKKIAKIMKYSGMNLGLLRVRKLFSRS